VTGYKKYYPCVSRQTDKGGGLQIQIKCKQRCKNNRVTINSYLQKPQSTRENQRLRKFLLEFKGMKRFMNGTAINVVFHVHAHMGEDRHTQDHILFCNVTT